MFNLAPVIKFREDDENGFAAVGYKVFTYLAGTSTKSPTYQDAAGMTANTNPIILDARGEASIRLNPTLQYKFIFSPPDDTDPPTDPIWTVDDIGGTANPLVITDPLSAEIQLLDSGTLDGVSIAFDVGTGLLAFSPVDGGVTGSATVTIDPIAGSTSLINTPDPLTINTDDAMTITAGTSISMESGTSLTLESTTALNINSGAALLMNSVGVATLTSDGTMTLQALGDALVLAGFTMPLADGAADSTLVTNGSGQLSFTSAGNTGNFSTFEFSFSNGLLLKFGYFTCVGAGGLNAIVFTTPFPTAISAWWCSINGGGDRVVGISAPTVSGLTVEKSTLDSFTYTGCWFAVGH